MENLIEAFKNLNANSFKNIGSLPFEVRATVLFGGVVGIFIAGYIVIIAPLISEINGLKQQGLMAREEFAKLNRQLPNLKLYEQQILELEEVSNILLQLLPESVDVDEVLRDIYDVAEENEVTIENFNPNDKFESRGFYSELPIKISVTSTYHDFGKFVSDLAEIPRIITLDNFSISPVGSGAKNIRRKQALLRIDFVAKTYKYEEEGEEKEQQ